MDKNFKDQRLIFLFLCVIPVVNIISGLLLMIQLGRRNRQALFVGALSTIIGIGYIMATGYFLVNSTVVMSAHDLMAESQLNGLVKEIEYHKSLQGHYPNALSELEIEDGVPITIYETYRTSFNSGPVEFYYELSDDGFILFSRGADGLEFTHDDVLPPIESNRRVGLKISEYHQMQDIKTVKERLEGKYGNSQPNQPQP